MLILHDKHTPADLREWSHYEAADLIHGARQALAAKVRKSRETLQMFVRAGSAYVSVSWGKDSTVLAELAAGLGLVYCWVREEPLFNPDCLAVRDAFLRRRPETRYEEIVVHCRRGRGTWHATGTLESGFAECVRRFGQRYVLGIRAEESGGRAIRMWRHGLASVNACAPLGWWQVPDVFGFLAVNDLPVHPVYGMLGGGRWPREHIRVCSLGGQRGANMGRDEWEREYYGDVLGRLQHAR